MADFINGIDPYATSRNAGDLRSSAVQRVRDSDYGNATENILKLDDSTVVNFKNRSRNPCSGGGAPRAIQRLRAQPSHDRSSTKTIASKAEVSKLYICLATRWPTGLSGEMSTWFQGHAKGFHHVRQLLAARRNIEDECAETQRHVAPKLQGNTRIAADKVRTERFIVLHRAEPVGAIFRTLTEPGQLFVPHRVASLHRDLMCDLP